jgi:asparagine synthase (glutamine-hydrolysing)
VCGISGAIAPQGTFEDAVGFVGAMMRALVHRGPDGQGTWRDRDLPLVFGHNRLAIMDCSSAGAQPMLCASGRYVLNFNGEIYNFADLRRALDAESGRSIAWRGHSDTEVLVEAIDAWGVENAIKRSEGMFALAAWDRRERTLWLLRDRIGEKPLYYGQIGTTFAFASEIGALYAAFGGRLAVDHAVLAKYLRGGHIPAPHSVYRGIQKLRPGHLVRMAFRTGTPSIPVQVRYWSLRQVIPQNRSLSPQSQAGAVAGVETVLREAVAERMMGDVPVGAFLSGGVDSSLIVALMAQRSPTPVQTFTIAFEDRRYDESRYADAVVARLSNVVHTPLTVTAKDYLASIPRLVATFGEPFADAALIPTFLLARLARGSVKVALSGEGADELFGGYDKYFDAKRIWRVLSRIPVPVRRMLAQLLMMPSVGTWDRLLKHSRDAREPGGINGDRIHKLASTLSVADRQQFYSILSGSWRPLRDVVREDDEPMVADDTDLDGLDFFEEMMAIDLTSSRPEGILMKIDRATMAVGLESRAPFLGERVVAHAWQLPIELKMNAHRGKVVLREILARYLPPEICNRQKIGFSTPLEQWLRGAFRAWAEHLLEPGRLAAGGFQPAAVRQKWREHLSGTRNWQYALWPVLMWQAYFDELPPAREVA